MFIASMVLSQFLCSVDNTLVTKIQVSFGYDSRSGIAPITGINDAPFADRSLVCVVGTHGNEPWLVNQAILKGYGKLINTSGTYIGGYRVINRNKISSIDYLANNVYQSVCDQIEATLQSIFKAYDALGFDNLESDHIRVVIDDRAYAFPDALPVLVIPFYDNAQTARYAIGGSNGGACVFRLLGSFADKSISEAIFRSVNRTVRYERFAEWLGRRNGVWRSGWYEDQFNSKWNGDMCSYSATDLDITQRQFDLRSGKVDNCGKSSACNLQILPSYTWTSGITTRSKTTNVTSVYVANSTQMVFSRTVQPALAQSLQNTAGKTSCPMHLLLFFYYDGCYQCWVCIMGTFAGKLSGISCVAGSTSFKYFVPNVLPHLKMVLCAIWTVGCDFEGQQLGMPEARFVVYPSIVEFTLMYFSLLNLVAKIFRRRVTDVLFGPTIITFCALHYFRNKLANSGGFRGVEGRVTTVVYSSDDGNFLPKRWRPLFFNAER